MSDTTGLRVILIGGPSHAGKSTLAQALANRLGWQYRATDRLARYPGRPWGDVLPHVAEHYLSHSPDQLIEGVIRHYASMWPDIYSLITTHARDTSTERLILEGSALWPDSIATLRLHGVEAVWLTASDGFLQRRIHAASGFEHASAQEQIIIDKFLGRAQRYNQRMMQIVRRLGLRSINVEESAGLERLVDTCLNMFWTHERPA